MNLTLRTKRLIGPFRSQLILLVTGLLLSLSPAAAGPVYVIGHECDPAAYAATWSKATGKGPALTSVTASTAVPGTYIVRGHGFSAGGVVEIAAYDACGIDRLDGWETVATHGGRPMSGAPDPEVRPLLQGGLVVLNFDPGLDGLVTIRAFDEETSTWSNMILVEGPAADRAECNRDCHRSRGIGPNP